MHPKDIGTYSELSIERRAVQKKILISKPHSENCRYDMVFDMNQRLARVQVKTARVVDKFIIFHTSSQHYDPKTKKRYDRKYVGEVDFFAIYAPELDKCFLIPSEIIGSRSAMRLALCKTKISNKRTYYAKDFLF